MESYLMMLYVTLEQETALKSFFGKKGWEFCKPDLSVTTDRVGPLKPDGTEIQISQSTPKPALVQKSVPVPLESTPNITPSKRPVRAVSKRRYGGIPINTAPFVKCAKLSPSVNKSPVKSSSKQPDTIISTEVAPDVMEEVHVHVAEDGTCSETVVRKSELDDSDLYIAGMDETGDFIDDGDNDDDFVDSEFGEATFNTSNADDTSEGEGLDDSQGGAMSQEAGPSGEGGTKARNNVGRMQTRQNYRCSMCGMKCKTIMLLKQHLKRHPEKLHVCTECGGQFSTPEQVEEHMTTHVEEAEDSKLDVSKFYSAKVKCGKCGEVVEDMMNHLENCDVELEDNPMCKKCDQRFENEVELMEHIPKCKVGPYTCNICNLVIKRMSSLRRHLKLHDPASAKYQCEVCDRSFHQRWDLVEHEYTHKPKVDCSACGRKISNVRNHMKICKKALADKRLTRCKNCDKVFASMEAKKAHMKDCKIDLHPCDICGLTYTQLGSLRLHKKKHHDREQGDFECMTCGMRFFVKFQLEEHEHVHRPKVTCENCGKLVHPTKRHLAVCRKPKLHECEYCGARVKGSSSHLKRHIDRHHPEYATKGQKKYEPYEQKRKFEHECETCGESFMYKGWLEAHQSECQGFIKPKEVVITNMKTEDKGGNPEDGLIAEEVEVAMLLPSVVAETEGEAGTETMLTDLATNTVYIIKH